MEWGISKLTMNRYLPFWLNSWTLQLPPLSPDSGQLLTPNEWDAKTNWLSSGCPSIDFRVPCRDDTHIDLYFKKKEIKRKIGGSLYNIAITSFVHSRWWQCYWPFRVCPAFFSSPYIGRPIHSQSFYYISINTCWISDPAIKRKK